MRWEGGRGKSYLLYIFMLGTLGAGRCLVELDKSANVHVICKYSPFSYQVIFHCVPWFRSPSTSG